MQTFSIPYGRSSVQFNLPDQITAEVILPPVTQSLPAARMSERIEQSLANPLGGNLLDSFNGARSVAIAVNDKTRPVPYAVLLPPLLQYLERIGIPHQAIRLFIANGTHTPMPPSEYARILPEQIIARYAILSHDSDDLAGMARLGTTSRGTDVMVNRDFYKADLKIVTGNIEPHHFAGFSGGVKTASIGLGGRTMINKNHAMLNDPHSYIGIYEENPLRQDIEEIGDQIGINYALNFVLSGEHEVAEVLFGSPRKVMQAGIPIARRICQTPVHGKYDIVIASAGGHPKDINLYQAQKAMTHASLLARDGGTLILAAACPEGPGSASYEAYVQGVPSHQAILEKFSRDGFRVGPHKSFQIARIVLQYGFILVSDMQPDRVRSLLLTPETSLQRAVDRVLHDGQTGVPRIAVLPHATSTIPVMV